MGPFSTTQLVSSCFPPPSRPLTLFHFKCVRHGHELVCLANLYPPAAVSDEADSFMYQSAAHTAIEAQAECFGKPLIRRCSVVCGWCLNEGVAAVADVVAGVTRRLCSHPERTTATADGHYGWQHHHACANGPGAAPSGRLVVSLILAAAHDHLVQVAVCPTFHHRLCSPAFTRASTCSWPESVCDGVICFLALLTRILPLSLLYLLPPATKRQLVRLRHQLFFHVLKYSSMRVLVVNCRCAMYAGGGALSCRLKGAFRARGEPVLAVPPHRRGRGGRPVSSPQGSQG